MYQQMSIFDFLPKSEKAKILPKKSTDWNWNLAGYPPKNGLKAFSLFACAGGSTMGYKLAGCDVVGCVEIDPKMNEIYLKNHKPKHNYCMDVREFNNMPNEQLPQELFNLDILDGSPPCSTFSMSGNREKDWGVAKKFREGQKLQTLDDLPFVMIETVNKLRPKVVIMENVEGLVKGNAWHYVRRIYSEFYKIGYKVRHKLLHAEKMGVPQRRHRVFFVATRLDFDLQNIKLEYDYEPILFGKIADGKGRLSSDDTAIHRCLAIAKPQDKNFAAVYKRIGEKDRNFNSMIVWRNQVCPTIMAKSGVYDAVSKRHISNHDILSCQTFPQDFDFVNDNLVNYVCGMSVPPIMIKRIVNSIIDSGIFAQ